MLISVKEASKHGYKHSIMIKQSILQEGIIVLNLYTPKDRASNQNTWSKKSLELKEEIDPLFTVGDFMTPFSVIDQVSRKSVRI